MQIVSLSPLLHNLSRARTPLPAYARVRSTEWKEPSRNSPWAFAVCLSLSRIHSFSLRSLQSSLHAPISHLPPPPRISDGPSPIFGIRDLHIEHSGDPNFFRGDLNLDLKLGEGRQFVIRPVTSSHKFCIAPQWARVPSLRRHTRCFGPSWSKECCPPRPETLAPSLVRKPPFLEAASFACVSVLPACLGGRAHRNNGLPVTCYVRSHVLIWVERFLTQKQFFINLLSHDSERLFFSGAYVSAVWYKISGWVLLWACDLWTRGDLWLEVSLFYNKCNTISLLSGWQIGLLKGI